MANGKESEIETTIKETAKDVKKVIHEILKVILPLFLVKVEKPKPEGSNIYKVLKQLGFFD